MSKLLISFVVTFFLLAATSSAQAAWKESDVTKFAEDLIKKKTLVKSIPAPTQKQLIIETDLMNYVIDFVLEDCFLSTKQGGVAVYSCEKIKKGVPLVAPLITW